MKENIIKYSKNFISIIELIIATGIALAVVISLYTNTLALINMNWFETSTIAELIRRVFFILILLELIYDLLTHDFNVLIDLVALIVARKSMQPDNSALDILLIALAFGLLICARFFTKTFNFKR
jgi:uncharacterized membrane protein (DUF373 family)